MYVGNLFFPPHNWKCFLFWREASSCLHTNKTDYKCSAQFIFTTLGRKRDRWCCSILLQSFSTQPVQRPLMGLCLLSCLLATVGMETGIGDIMQSLQGYQSQTQERCSTTAKKQSWQGWNVENYGPNLKQAKCVHVCLGYENHIIVWSQWLDVWQDAKRCRVSFSSSSSPNFSFPSIFHFFFNDRGKVDGCTGEHDKREQRQENPWDLWGLTQ